MLKKHQPIEHGIKRVYLITTMKTTALRVWMAVCLSALTATAAISASADQAAMAAKPEKSYTGTVTSVDLNNHVLNVKGWIFSKKFNLGDNCTYTSLDKNAGTINDLRPGEKVNVRYQDASGVLVADGVTQQPMRYEGMVKAIDPAAHTLTLHSGGIDRQLQIADNCTIVLRGDKPGTFADIQPGNHVTVTYEVPDGKVTARQIAQTSTSFTGTLTAIDLGERTVKAKSLFDTKKFNLADNCAIVINGKPDGQLSDLKPDDKLVFSYNDINGINIVNRIAPAEASSSPVVTSETQ
jgi:Cu/Ag efflux protein CusF